jgi:hypothetical protein
MKKLFAVCVMVFLCPYVSAGTWTTTDNVGLGISGNRIYSYPNLYYDGSIWTTFSVPGSTATEIRGLSGSKIVGIYYDDALLQNFLYDGQTWTNLDLPGMAYDIDGSNIVGHTGGSSFLYDGATSTILNMPGALETRAYGVSGGNIVGEYYNDIGNRDHSFLYDGLTWTELNVPGSSSVTHVRSIDGGNIVGYYDGGYHSFLYDGSAWTTLDAPGAIETRAYGISGNNIVGYYRDISGNHGFIYTIPEPATICLFAFAGLMLRRRK